MMYYLLKYIFYLPIKFFWFKKIYGLQNLPSGSFIIAANHSSYLDFVLLFIFIPKKISFLAAEKFFKHPIWYLIMKATSQIKVERLSSNKEDVYKEVAGVFQRNGVLGIFPEGTRSRTGCLNKAYSGVAKFAYKHNVPVVPIGIIGTFEAWPPNNKIPNFHRCTINIGESIVVSSDDFAAETKKIMLSISKLSFQKYEY